MSSIDQAFVKAFARRNQTHRRADKPASDDGVMEIDRSVAETTDLWIDSEDDKVIRADVERGGSVPRPHLAPDPATPAANAAAESAAAENATQPSTDVPGTGERVAHESEASEAEVRWCDQPNLDTSLESLQQLYTAYVGACGPLDIGSLAIDAVPPPDPAVLPETAGQQLPGLTDRSGVSDQIGPLEQRQSDSAEQPEAAPLSGADLPTEPIAAQPDPAPAVEQPEVVSAAVPENLPTFKPVWEVDSFEIPRTVSELFYDSALFEQIAQRMTAAIQTGLRTVLVTSVRSGEGRSSVAIGIALAAAARGNRVALLDADIAQPTLADDLRLDVQYGWVDALRGGLPVEEVSVHAIKDQLTLVPLMVPHAATAATDQEIESVILRLRKSFDLVVIDGSVAGAQGTDWSTSVIETALIVRDRSKTDADDIYRLTYRLREAGVRGVGLVENFA